MIVINETIPSFSILNCDVISIVKSDEKADWPLGAKCVQEYLPHDVAFISSCSFFVFRLHFFLGTWFPCFIYTNKKKKKKTINFYIAHQALYQTQFLVLFCILALLNIIQRLLIVFSITTSKLHILHKKSSKRKR